MKRLLLGRAVIATAAAAALVASGPTALAEGGDCGARVFVESPVLPGGTGVRIRVADLNGDGIPDIVSPAGNGFQVLLGNGGGAFTTLPVVPTSNSVGDLVVADLDGDGKLDVAAADTFVVGIFLGHNDGTFDVGDTYSGATIATGLVSGDFDGDGNVDLAEIGISNDVILLLGHGDGTFASGSLPLDSRAASIGVGDFNGDGRSDLALSLSFDGIVAVYPSNGDGTFGSPYTVPLALNEQPLVVADIDGDGRPDIVQATTFTLATLLGNGDGTFQDPRFSALDLPADALAVGDFDGDGFLDLAGQQGTGQFVTLFEGFGNGLFAANASYLAAGNLAAADFDGDGLLDLAGGDYWTGAPTILFNRGGFRMQGIGVIPAVNFPAVLAAGDFDGDGQNDLEILLGFEKARLFSGDGRGGFLYTHELELGAGVSWLAAGDWNGDGKLDLAFVGPTSMTLSFALGNGDGSFPAPTPMSVAFLPHQLAAGDLNGDGFADLVVTADTPGGQPEVGILLANGDGSFASPAAIDLATGSVAAAIADLDGDGKPDLAVAGGSSVAILLGHGDGTFGSPVAYGAGPGATSVAVGDFDDDGRPDLAVAVSNVSAVSILLGDGTGSFAPPLAVAVGAAPLFVSVADFDGDGEADLATANGNANSVSLLLGQGDGTFAAPQVFHLAGTPVFLAPASFTPGGAIDLVVGSNAVAVDVLLNARLRTSTVADAQVIVGSPATLHVEAAGFGGLAYQWRKGGVPLTDGGRISGATTDTLTIASATFGDAGVYDVFVTDTCGSIASNAATLSVEFDDVPLSNPFHDDIITIATAGITGGCNTGSSYCPSNPVSRAEMAVLLLKAKYGADHVPPPPPPVPIFPDVPADAFAAAWIDELATLGITAGCGDGNGNYCPDAPVTRGQMAVFLLKTLIDSNYVPPPPVGLFSDVPLDYFAIAWIEDLYNRGITAGCASNPLQYCPDANVPREQMATFIVRTFALP